MTGWWLFVHQSPHVKRSHTQASTCWDNPSAHSCGDQQVAKGAGLRSLKAASRKLAHSGWTWVVKLFSSTFTHDWAAIFRVHTAPYQMSWITPTHGLMHRVWGRRNAPLLPVTYWSLLIHFFLQVDFDWLRKCAWLYLTEMGFYHRLNFTSFQPWETIDYRNECFWNWSRSRIVLTVLFCAFTNTSKCSWSCFSHGNYHPLKGTTTTKIVKS